MVWNKQCDTFADDMDAKGISCEAYVLHNTAQIFCNRMLTDGRIPRHMTRRLYSAISDVDRATAELLAAGLWVETDDGYELVGFLVDQKSAETIRREREATRKRQQRFAAASRARKAGKSGANAVSNGVSNGYPDPTRNKGGSGSGSPRGSPSPRPGEEPTSSASAEPETTHFQLSGLECSIRAFPANKGGPHDGPHTCVEFWVGDEGDEFVAAIADTPAGQQMAELHQAVYDKALELAQARHVRPPRADSRASLSSVEIVVPDDEARAWWDATDLPWRGLLVSATSTAEVEALAGQLAEALEERST
jgi:hypothetical protein